MTARRFVPAVTVAALAALFLAGCAAPAAQSEPDATSTASAASELLAAHDLDGLDAREVVDRLDALPVAGRPADLIASVRPDHVELSDDQGRTASLPLPDDVFYTSVAPYADRTHDCFFHSLTTCLGELSNADVRVIVTASDGTVVLDEMRTTNDNGFVGLWLPRGIQGTITVESEGLRASQAFATDADSPTCLTTLQLS
ncbi:CueP family metal-binding protein [Microbacterium sp. YJN-G]|uniref:CueP family metal-binding protein n=1 Tax=Microbacterium sp. YJN-G TaxID=2763257 RepID=UPI001878C4FB|nr:CueP family metal-binding protein [Microbacterium sp. YJN-G]